MLVGSLQALIGAGASPGEPGGRTDRFGGRVYQHVGIVRVPNSMSLGFGAIWMRKEEERQGARSEMR